MNRKLCGTAFFLGLIAVGWVGVGYVGAHPLALAMTVIIGVVYVVGALELLRFHQATSSLGVALAAIPANLANLGDWLRHLHPSLQNPVRLRIEGERAGLPGPGVTPYLVGLLVMLGMLGTFLGMVVTLNGAVLALESTSDLQTIRAALAAPVKGLGLAFGTSVAGVAASAMLGLISSLLRRERQQTGQLLDTKIATVLRGFSLVHQRQETFKALQFQSQALPDVADKLQAVLAQMERQSQQLNERLQANQEGFYREVKGVFAELASGVDQSLKQNVRESARLAGETIRPVVEATMAGIAHETAALHEKMAATFEQRAAALVAAVNDAHTVLQTDFAAREQQRLAALTQSLEALAAGLQREWQQVGAQSLAQQQRICETFEERAREATAQAQTLSSHTIGEVAKLMQTAAEAPRAAAEVIGQLRQELSASVARDNALLEERSRIMETLSALLDAINHAAAEQRGSIDSLVASSAALLERVGGEFADQAGTASAQMAEATAQATGSAVEVASLGEAFGFAVQQFSEANDKMIASLQRIEGSLDKSLARSDEQLAYYVAQAREIIDLSIMSQKQIVDDLQQLAGKPALAGGVG